MNEFYFTDNLATASGADNKVWSIITVNTWGDFAALKEVENTPIHGVRTLSKPISRLEFRNGYRTSNAHLLQNGVGKLHDARCLAIEIHQTWHRHVFA